MRWQAKNTWSNSIRWSDQKLIVAARLQPSLNLTPGCTCKACVSLATATNKMKPLAEILLRGLALYSAACAASTGHRRQYWPEPEPNAITPEECIGTSFTNPTWGIYSPSLVAVNISSGGTQGDVRFLTVNSATGVSANCTAKDIDLDPKGAGALDLWHSCSIPNLFFQFNLESLDMRLKGSWQCDNSSR